MIKAPKAPEHLRKLNWYLPHQAWCVEHFGFSRHDPDGASSRCACLRGADLSGADLREADLRSADLSGVDLSLSRLAFADLSRANLRSADLSGADLLHTNFSCSDLSEAFLKGAFNIYKTDLTCCNLSGAKLSDRLVEYLAKFYPAEYLGHALSLGLDGDTDGKSS